MSPPGSLKCRNNTEVHQHQPCRRMNSICKWDWAHAGWLTPKDILPHPWVGDLLSLVMLGSVQRVRDFGTLSRKCGVFIRTPPQGSGNCVEEEVDRCQETKAGGWYQGNNVFQIEQGWYTGPAQVQTRLGPTAEMGKMQAPIPLRLTTDHKEKHHFSKGVTGYTNHT